MTKPTSKIGHEFSEHVFGKDDPRQSLVLAAARAIKRQAQERREHHQQTTKAAQLAKTKNTNK